MQFTFSSKCVIALRDRYSGLARSFTTSLDSNHRREGVSAERRIRREINWEHGLCRLSWRSRGFLQCIKFSIKIHILRYTRKKFNHISTTVKIIRYNIKHNLKYIYTGILKVLYSYLLTMHIQKLLLHYSEFISFQEDTIP